MPPAVGAAIGAVGSIASSAIGAHGNKGYTVVPLKPPAPLLPGVNKQFAGTIGAAGGTGLSNLQATAKSGDMQDVSKLVAAITAAQQRQTQEGQASIEEQFAASGMRFSSDLMRNLVDYRLQSNKDLSAQVQGLYFQAYEASKGRQLQASSLLTTLFSEAAMSYYPTQAIVGTNPPPNYFQQGLSGALGGIELAKIFR